MLEFLYQDTITVSTREQDGNWLPRVLRSVHVIENGGESTSYLGDRPTDNATVNIRYTGNREDTQIGEWSYLSPKEFRKSTNKSECITFSYGDAFDFFYVGEWESEEPISDTDYVKHGGFYNWMNRNYDRVYAITGCSKYNYLPHFTVTGR